LQPRLLRQQNPQRLPHPDLIIGNQNPHIDSVDLHLCQAENLSYPNDPHTSYDDEVPGASDAW